MRRTHAVGILCAFTAMVLAAACGDDDSTGGTGYDGGSTTDGSTTDGSSDDGSSTDGSATDGARTDGSTDGGDGGGTVTGKLVDFNAPSSPKKAKDGDSIHVTGVVATTSLFLVSKSAKTCNYGVFVVDANATFVPYSGILAFASGVGTGDGGTTCPMTSALPAAVNIGDTLDITGTYTLFSSTCGGVNPTPVPGKGLEIVVTASSKVGTATPPPAVVVTEDDLRGTSIAGTPKDAGADADAGDAGDAAADAGPGGDPLKYTGGLVQLANVTAATKTDSFGVFTTASGLAVGSKIYALTAYGKPTIAAGQTFDKVIGIGGYLDFCTWGIEPRTPCDYTPALADAGTCP